MAKALERALTVRQPWAALIAAGVKDVENRTWQSNYRGPLAIHAGHGRDFDIEGWAAVGEHGLQEEVLVRGAIVAVVDLTDIVTDSESPWALPDCFHWVLANPRPVDPPVQIGGQLGIWRLVGMPFTLDAEGRICYNGHTEGPTTTEAKAR